MHQLIFCTGNEEKFSNASMVAREFDIELTQQLADVDEIQGENDALRILKDKVAKAHAIIKQPIIVSDDSWEIPGLNGFPGPYMKSINHWFTPDDFLRLTRDLTDRRIFLIQNVAYTDGETTNFFTDRIEGELQTEARGRFGAALHKVVSMKGDEGLSIAEVFDGGVESANREYAKVWRDLFGRYLSSADRQP